MLLVVRFWSSSVKDLIVESKAKKKTPTKEHDEGSEAIEMREVECKSVFHLKANACRGFFVVVVMSLWRNRRKMHL